MKPLTAEWVAKAEADLRAAEREFAAPVLPGFDAACFHAQQCAEKYLKACLQEQGTRIPRVHDLRALLPLMHNAPVELTQMMPALRVLSDLAVSTRYPGYSADLALAEEAIATAQRVRAICRTILGLVQEP